MDDAVEFTSGAKDHRLVVRSGYNRTAALHLGAPIVLTHLIVVAYLPASDDLPP